LKSSPANMGGGESKSNFKPGTTIRGGSHPVKCQACRFPSEFLRGKGMKLSIVESSEDAIVALTLDGIVVSWDRGAQKIYGYQSKEIIGKPLSVLLPSDRPEDISEILEKIKSGERVDHYETARLRKDGQIVYVSLTVFPIRNTASRIIGASSIIRDITKRKETENALRESRGHLARTQAFPMC